VLQLKNRVADLIPPQSFLRTRLTHSAMRNYLFLFFWPAGIRGMQSGKTPQYDNRGSHKPLAAAHAGPGAPTAPR
jgi:hypothetical protein